MLLLPATCRRFRLLSLLFSHPVSPHVLDRLLLHRKLLDRKPSNPRALLNRSRLDRKPTLLDRKLLDRRPSNPRALLNRSRLDCKPTSPSRRRFHRMLNPLLSWRRKELCSRRRSRQPWRRLLSLAWKHFP